MKLLMKYPSQMKESFLVTYVRRIRSSSGVSETLVCSDNDVSSKGNLEGGLVVLQNCEKKICEECYCRFTCKTEVIL